MNDRIKAAQSYRTAASIAPRPLIIGHRGASGLRPEHTLAAYQLAIEQGADFIEPDVVTTKDGVLVARHENEISQTTDVADRPEFGDRQITKLIDGQAVTGWFTEDFTLAELKTLRAKERLSFRNQSYNGLFAIPTLQEAIDLTQQKSAELGRAIGIYPETKHPTYFKAIGLPLEQRLLDVLKTNGYDKATDPVFIQSFEVSNLKRLRQLTDLPLIQLLDALDSQPYDFVTQGGDRTCADLLTPTGLADIATYATGIGIWKQLLVPTPPVAENAVLKSPHTLIEAAHHAGLLVHAYTCRNEACYLNPQYNGNPELEYKYLFGLGLDGVFSDFPGTALQVAQRLYPLSQANHLRGIGRLAESAEC